MKHVLMIEDEPTFFDAVQQTLQDLDHKVTLHWLPTIATSKRIDLARFDRVYVDICGTFYSDFSEEFKSIKHSNKIICSGQVVPIELKEFPFVDKGKLVEDLIKNYGGK